MVHGRKNASGRESVRSELKGKIGRRAGELAKADIAGFFTRQCVPARASLGSRRYGQRTTTTRNEGPPALLGAAQSHRRTPQEGSDPKPLAKTLTVQERRAAATRRGASQLK